MTYKEKSGIFAYMKKLVLLFSLLPLLGMSQMRSSYEKRMDSLAVAHMDLGFRYSHGKTYIATLRPKQWVKITFKTTVNKNILRQIKFDEIFEEGLDLGADDIMSLAAYDMRTKFYLNSKYSITTRIFATGLQSQKYFYTIGFVSKF